MTKIFSNSPGQLGGDIDFGGLEPAVAAVKLRMKHLLSAPIVPIRIPPMPATAAITTRMTIHFFMATEILSYVADCRNSSKTASGGHGNRRHSGDIPETAKKRRSPQFFQNSSSFHPLSAGCQNQKYISYYTAGETIFQGLQFREGKLSIQTLRTRPVSPFLQDNRQQQCSSRTQETKGQTD
ncbi:MAG: hypothetical protein L6W00_17190 [Lentisphaeria bacterium]|nr:MAG: hypothetical protein L6W00_17190 [Lentisphaeria bacterium]